MVTANLGGDLTIKGPLVSAPVIAGSINLAKTVITVPETAVDYTLYGDSVYLITEKVGEDGKTSLTVTRSFVQTGNRINGRAEILKGLKPGDRVVAVGQLKLQPGAAVTISTDPVPAIPAQPPRY